jgi:hypothetical protein
MAFPLFANCGWALACTQFRHFMPAKTTKHPSDRNKGFWDFIVPELRWPAK